METETEPRIETGGTKVVARIRLSYLATVAAAALLLVVGHLASAQGVGLFMRDADGLRQETVRAAVLRAETVPLDPEMHHILGDRFVFFEAEIRNGERRGEIVAARQSFAGFVQEAVREVAPGDSVLLVALGDEWFFNGFRRANRLLVLGVLFAACAMIFGGRKGFNILLSLAFTCAAVFAVFIPSILSGRNIHLMAVLVCAYTTVVTLLLVVGYNKKSLAAMVGCLGGIAAAGVIALIMDRALFLTGVVGENSRFLTFLPIDVNLRAIIFAGIIIGAMYATLPGDMSIASTMWEIRERAPAIRFEALLRSGMTIGGDMFGTMANTLILAYIGSSLSVILVLLVHSDSPAALLNQEMIVVEILQALAGSFGILLAIPLTGLFCAAIYPRKDGREAAEGLRSPR